MENGSRYGNHVEVRRVEEVAKRRCCDAGEEEGKKDEGGDG